MPWPVPFLTAHGPAHKAEAMLVLLINLDRSTDRLAFQERQLATLGLTFRRIPAVTADAASGARSEEYWNSWERPLRPAERACLLSHVAAWKRVVAAGQPALILEDDAVLSRRVPEVLVSLEGMTGLDHVSFETRGRRKLMGHQARMAGDVTLHRLYQDRTGAAAYVLWPSGAAKLITRATHEAGLADAMICRAYELSSWQTDPALALQLDICARYGVRPPIETRSTIDGAGADRPPANTAQKRRRILSQLRMGWRQLSRLGRAKRREVRPDAADFS